MMPVTRENSITDAARLSGNPTAGSEISSFSLGATMSILCVNPVHPLFTTLTFNAELGW